MKFIRFFGVLWILMPLVSWGAVSSELQNASKLLVAARNGDTRTMQTLIDNGADVNYVDSTGLSLVCTAVMNNDKRAIQVLQMYGADASKCDRQIKQYKQKKKVATSGEEYGFFSGLSSSHIIALSAVAVAGVIGGVALLTNAFDSGGNGNSSSSSGGSHSGGGGGSGSTTATKSFTVPYGPVYLSSDGTINTNVNISTELAAWDSGSSSELRKEDFAYMNASPLQNYLLTMGGYYSLANGYMGQKIFRAATTNVPLKSETGFQGKPIQVALITGSGINPVGSVSTADSTDPTNVNVIQYANSTALGTIISYVDKYANNSVTYDSESKKYVETEQSGFDLSGSGTVFNPFANVNETALAKIVAGWEGTRESEDGALIGDLYGFIPNGQLAIYRTGNGKLWKKIDEPTSGTSLGTFTDADSNGSLSAGDSITLGSTTYTVSLVDSNSLTINGTNYVVAANSKLFVGKCGTDCADIAIYVGTDDAWYINSSGGNNIDNVYIADSGNVYKYKEQVDDVYKNFSAISSAKGQADVVANVSILPESVKPYYLTVNTFAEAARQANTSDLKAFYTQKINDYYGNGEGGVANTLLNNYNTSQPMIIMPAGDYLSKDSSGQEYLSRYDATFENYAPLIYGNNINHDFMTVVAVMYENGTSSATTIADYGDGTGSSFGKIVFSKWSYPDSGEEYSSRKCGIAGQGNAASGVDPWCFAAAAPTAQMAAAATAGAVASVKSAFNYMTNEQIFTLLALTADGPYLGSTTSGTAFTKDTLATYLQNMYNLSYNYDGSDLSTDEYLDKFKDYFGFGLINLQRAIQPGFSVYYYADGGIVSASGSQNQFWRDGVTSSTSSRASSVLSLTNRGAINASFYDVLQSVDGDISLPRVWNTTLATGVSSKHNLYMGDVLGDFNVDSTNKRSLQFGNMKFDMAMSGRDYNDNLNGLDDLKIAFSNENYDINAEYQHYLTDGESRFYGRANGLLALTSNVLSGGAKYKYGNFEFGGHAFAGTISDENLLEKDPVVSSQFEPARLGLANGGAMDMGYHNDKFGFNVSFGNMSENKTVLGALNEGLLSLNGANTQYVDVVTNYKPFEKMNLSARATFANTRANVGDGIISELSDIKSNAFAFGADLGGLSLTVALPLAITDGKMGYGYADLSVAENNGNYDIVVNNPHTEYIDLSANKRELRFSGSYKRAIGGLTDAGVGFIYRVNPNNTDVFGNESILMFKIHHRVGI